MEAVLRGVGDIVPLDILKLFTWREVEILACGLNSMDLELLKRMTKVEEGVGKREVSLLWQVLESFTEEERSLFLRFVWGRSRLPLREQDCESFACLSQSICRSMDRSFFQYLSVFHLQLNLMRPTQS